MSYFLKDLPKTAEECPGWTCRAGRFGSHDDCSLWCGGWARDRGRRDLDCVSWPLCPVIAAADERRHTCPLPKSTEYLRRVVQVCECLQAPNTLTLRCGQPWKSHRDPWKHPSAGKPWKVYSVRTAKGWSFRSLFIYIGPRESQPALSQKRENCLTTPACSKTWKAKSERNPVLVILVIIHLSAVLFRGLFQLLHIAGIGHFGF